MSLLVAELNLIIDKLKEQNLALSEKLAAVAARHVSDGTRCDTCDVLWPCSTARIVADSSSMSPSVLVGTPKQETPAAVEAMKLPEPSTRTLYNRHIDGTYSRDYDSERLLDSQDQQR